MSEIKTGLDLKITPYLDEIKEMILSNQITIISCPTAFGKSLGIPAHLYSEGYNIAITEPRIFLANSIVDINRNLNNIKGQVITSRALNKTQNSEFCVFTEGSYLNNGENFDFNVLFVDEVHEQNINTEIIIYEISKFVKKGIKVVLLSATFDLQKYVTYLSKFKTAVFEIPQGQREYSITVQEVPDIELSLTKFKGRVLYGQIGKEEMEFTKFRLEQLKYPNPIFTLHGEIEEEMEEEIMQYEGDCVILATSVAMSGMNFKKLNLVIPPLQCKKPNSNGVLSKVDLSIAELTQWEGRTGRMCDGLVWYGDLRMLKNLDKNPTPEIMAAPLMDTYLRLLGRGYQLDKIQLLNQPSQFEVRKAKQILIDNNLIDSLDNDIYVLTQLGYDVLRYDTIEEGLLILEAKKEGIENTIAKICVLIKKDIPFKKNYSFKNKVRKSCEISKLSEHYMYVKCLEEDESLYLDKEALKLYCTDNGVIRKRFKDIRYVFNAIDKKVKDETPLTLEKIQNVLNKGLTINRYNNMYNEKTDVSIVSNNIVEENVYANLTPIQLRFGRLTNMVTKLK